MSADKQDDISGRLEEIEAVLGKIEAALEGMEESKKMNVEVEGTEKGVASGAIDSLGDILPGLGKLLETLKESPAFQERLQDMDYEAELRLGGGEISTGGTFRSIPPGVRRGPGGPTARRGRPRGSATRKVKVGADTMKAVPADLFDEGDSLKVVAELPGYEEKEIDVGLEGTSLMIDASSARGKKFSRVELPCEVKEKLETSFRNGVLQVMLRKK
ncbi:MAG: Hsp20/alpha crystallin family protein [Actinomycetia bacterium]|nr:Hsp20/alpha crystallin family protein [Actinomycetes bacterium]